MKEVKRLSDDKLAGHNFPHAKLVRSLSPEEEQGSPVEEFFARDNDAMRFAPKVVRDKLGASAAAAAAAAPQPTQPAQSSPTSPSSSKPPGSRSYSTSATTTPVPEPASGDMDALLAMMNNPEQPQSQGQPPAPSPAGAGTVDGRAGLKFEMPPTPDYATGYLRKRYDPVLDQFTKMLMRHGQLATAERNMSAVIDILRTSPPPRLDPGRRLLYPLAPAEFPLNPLLYLTNAVDSVAPLLRIRQMKGAAGGGMSLPVPRPLNSRQRRRTAIAWILDASAKRRDYALPKRVAEEIIAVVEGRSGIWQKRDMLHKMGITARTNMSLGGGRR
ncbi:hypothetical protein KEM52_003605 [Ascosphaera acerosa]|nr:hypothetical protein KEM52_003605 [Ascosphaera acerosa]